MNLLIWLILLIPQFALSIDNGVPAVKDQYPYIVKIKNYKNGGFSHCTATYISSTVLITAAHCVDVNNFREQIVSEVGDPKGRLGLIFNPGKKVKKVFVNESYEENKAKFDLVNDYINSSAFKASHYEFQLKKWQERQNYLRGIINSDIAFVETEKIKKIDSIDFPRISCEHLKEMSEVVMVGYGVNEGSGQENSNFSFNQLVGKNWYTTGDDYVFEKQNGNLVNSGDSGGPLIEAHEKLIYGIASRKVLSNDKSKNTQSTFADLSSSDAHKLYQKIILDVNSPKELTDLVQDCIDKK